MIKDPELDHNFGKSGYEDVEPGSPFSKEEDDEVTNFGKSGYED